jgi:hypothetical protein
VSPDEEGHINADDQLLTSLEVGLLQDLRRTAGQLAATAWAQNNLPVPQVCGWSLLGVHGAGLSRLVTLLLVECRCALLAAGCL